jgi:two-component system sensor histidine kinase/response regulator
MDEDRIKRRLERERKAREAAERFLEQKSRELYQSNQQLQELADTLEQKVQDRTAELEKAIKQAETANLAKSQFLANISHEFRTPMNAILGMTHLLTESKLDDKQKDYVEKIERAGNNLLNIITSILNFSKSDNQQLKLLLNPFVIESLLVNLFNQLGKKAESKGLTFEYIFADKLPETVIGDKEQISQILTQIITNAIKFTKQGSVRITIQTTIIDAQQLELVFTIHDTGIGMTSKVLKNLYHSFQQADGSSTRQYDGIGMGLALSHNLIELMNGSIHCDSQPNQGTTFIIKLPVAISAEANKSSGPASDRIKPRILLTEDNLFNQELIIRLLSKHNYQIDKAENGAVALEKLARNQYDLILMDCEMPVMDGYTAVREIRAQTQFQTIPIIAITGADSREQVNHILQTGCDAHIAKPIKIDILLETLSGFLLPIPDAEKNIPDKPAKSIISADSILDQLQFKHINISMGLNHVDNDHDIYLNLLRKFKHNQADLMQKINEAVSRADTETLARLIHTLKGTSGNLGAESLHHYLLDTEKSFIVNAVDLDSKIQKLNQLFTEVMNDLESMENINAVESAQLAEISAEEVRQQVNEIIHLLEQFDPQSEEKLEQLIQKPLDKSLIQDLNKSKSLIEKYDYETALVLLKELTQS